MLQDQIRACRLCRYFLQFDQRCRQLFFDNVVNNIFGFIYIVELQIFIDGQKLIYTSNYMSLPHNLNVNCFKFSIYNDRPNKTCFLFRVSCLL